MFLFSRASRSAVLLTPSCSVGTTVGWLGHDTAHICLVLWLRLSGALSPLPMCLLGLHGENLGLLDCVMGWDGLVGIVTHYRLDGLGIECSWRRDFPRPSPPALGLTQPPIQWVRGVSRGVKQLGRGDHPPHLASKLKKG
jgi:hypothetical protein